MKVEIEKKPDRTDVTVSGSQEDLLTMAKALSDMVKNRPGQVLALVSFPGRPTLTFKVDNTQHYS